MKVILSRNAAPWACSAVLALTVSIIPWSALGQAYDEDEDEIRVKGSATATTSTEDDPGTEPGEQQAAPAGDEEPGVDARSTSVVTVEERDKEEYSNSFLRPSFGGIFFEEEDRLAAGFLLETNLSGSEEIIAGPVFGVIYSSIEGDGTAKLEDNDFILQIPAQLKLAWAPRNVPKISIGAHGGVNVIYSQASAFGDVSDDDRFNAYANVGGDLGVRVSRALEIGVRPDWTFLDDFDLFTITVGLGVAI